MVARKTHQQVPLWESNTFQRFIKVPLILSNLLYLVVLGAFIEVGILVSSWWLIFLIPSGLVFAGLLKLYANTKALRSRMWYWGKDKFDSWEEYSKWLYATSTVELDYIAGLPDDEWEPDYDNGGLAKDDNA